MKKTNPIPFTPFRSQDEIRIYKHGILPHWRQDGCTYFVTFRQADSLPRDVQEKLEENRQTWLQGHGIDPERSDWKIPFAELPEDEQREYERGIANKLNFALDKGFGSCVLRNQEVAEIVSAALTFHHDTWALTGDRVIMPNHVHVLLTPGEGFELEDILHSIKSFTANEINKHLGTEGAFWQRDSYDHIVRDGEQLVAFQRYIRDNPAKANLREDQFIHHEAFYQIR